MWLARDPVVQVASGEVWVGPTRGFDLTTRVRLTAIVVRGVSAPAGWKETSAEAASTSRGHLLTRSTFALGHPGRKAQAVVQADPAVINTLCEGN